MSLLELLPWCQPQATRWPRTGAPATSRTDDLIPDSRMRSGAGQSGESPPSLWTHATRFWAANRLSIQGSCEGVPEPSQLGQWSVSLTWPVGVFVSYLGPTSADTRSPMAKAIR